MPIALTSTINMEQPGTVWLLGCAPAALRSVFAALLLAFFCLRAFTDLSVPVLLSPVWEARLPSPWLYTNGKSHDTACCQQAVLDSKAYYVC